MRFLLRRNISQLSSSAGKRFQRLSALHADAWLVTSTDRPMRQASGCMWRDREALERLCRYGARAPIANSRLSLSEDGKAVIELKRPLYDGRTHLRDR